MDKNSKVKVIQITTAPAGMRVHHRVRKEMVDNGPITTKVACLALVEHPDGTRTVEPMVNKGADISLVNPDGFLGINWD